MKRFLCGAAAMLILALPLAARAEWPERPIKIIVPFPPGNSSDVAMRLLGEKLSTRLGQPVIIDNKVGAGGIVGTGQAAKAAPD
ncbi:tripartite tricarboxylate transporter substrate-binding protein [Alicycliphilus denitrificans]